MLYRVRGWSPRHVHDVARLVREAAAALGDPHEVKVTPEGLLAEGFGPRPRFGCLVAETAGEEGAVGLLLHYFSFCTWAGRLLFAEEIYVEPPHRGRGVGRALVEKAAEVAVAQGCAQVRALAPGGPGGPGGLLTHLGAADVSARQGWAVWHVPPPAMATLAGQRPGGPREPPGPQERP